MIDKTAGVWDTAIKAARGLLGAGLLVNATVVPAIGGAALLGGYAAGRLTSPRSIAENADKELEQEALATEIDVTTRRIAALENRKKQRASASKPKLYDRFV